MPRALTRSVADGPAMTVARSLATATVVARSLTTATIVAVVMVMATAGCGGGRPAVPSHAVSAKNAVSAKTWTTRVCQALTPWRGKITDLNARAAQQMRAATTADQTRTNLVALLDGARQASEDARVLVAGAGIPDVPDGTAIADRFVASLAGVRDAYDTARGTVAGLATTPTSAFYDGVATAMDTLNKQYARAGLGAESISSAALRKEFDAACG